MGSKAPPVPPDQCSNKIRGASSAPAVDPEVKRDPARDTSTLNLREQDRYGGIHQNITHQGRQQDR